MADNNNGISLVDAANVIDSWRLEYPACDSLDFYIAEKQEELYGPENTFEKVGRILGCYHPARGIVTFATTGFRDEDHLRRAFRHEVLGHFGLNTFNGTDKRAILKAVIKGRDSDPLMVDAWNEVSTLYPEYSDNKKAEEVFCFLTENVNGDRLQAYSCLRKTWRGEGLNAAEVGHISAGIEDGLKRNTIKQQIFPVTDYDQFKKGITMKNNRKPFHEEVAEKLIAQMEKGNAPFQKPWEAGEYESPMNPVTGKRYRGVNNLWLNMSGYGDPRWMTYKQASEQGWQVRKGESATTIEYWKMRETVIKKDENGKPEKDENGNPVKVTFNYDRPRVFYAKVFNAEQIDGIPALERKAPQEQNWEHLERVQRVLDASGVPIHHKSGDNAFYNPIRDDITLPAKEQFSTEAGYYEVAFHELGHSTGHKSRLARDLSGPFGSESYAKEELRAEIYSLMAVQEYGLPFNPGNHAAYTKSWIKTLKNDPREIFKASSDAEKILTFVKDLELKQEQTQSLDRGYVISNELQQEIETLGANSNEGYNIVETVNNLASVAKAANLTMTVEKRNGEADESPFIVKYHNSEGADTGISGELWQDGKVATSLNGDRVSGTGLSSDLSWQKDALESAISQMAERENAINIGISQATGYLGRMHNHQATAETEGFLLDRMAQGDAPLVAAMSFAEQESLSLSDQGLIFKSVELLGFHAKPSFESGITAANQGKADNAPDMTERVAIWNDRGETFYANINFHENTASLVGQKNEAGSDEVAPSLKDFKAFLTDIPDTYGAKVRLTDLVENHEKSLSENVAKALEITVPNDWNGKVEIRGNVENIEDGESIVELAEVAGRPAEFWSIYAQSEDGTHEFLADFDSENQAQEIAKSLESAYQLEANANEATPENAVLSMEVSRLFERQGSEELASEYEGKAVDLANVVLPGSMTENPFNVDQEPMLHRQFEKGAEAKLTQNQAERIRESTEALKMMRETNQIANEILKDSRAKTSDLKTFIAVPYADKEEAKSKGAKWDRQAKSWYVEPGKDLTPFNKWDANSVTPGRADPVSEFRDFLLTKGFEFPGGEMPNMDGKRHRVRLADDKPDQKSGSYRAYLDGRPAGTWDNFRSGEKGNWKAEGVSLSSEQRNALIAQSEIKLQAREEARQKSYNHHAKRCQQVYPLLLPVDPNHQYLKDKGIDATGDIKQDKKGNLVLPLRNIEGEIRSLQRISPNGFKSLKKGAEKQGNFHTLVAESKNGSSVILVSEGYSTGKTLAASQNNNIQTVAAIDAGNLPAVCAALKAKHPDKKIVPCGDDDRFNERGNKGRTKAEEAAELVGTVALFPRFDEKNQEFTDWNDLYQDSGMDSVKSQLAGPLGRLEAMDMLEEQQQANDLTQTASIAHEQKERQKKKEQAKEPEKQRAGRGR